MRAIKYLVVHCTATPQNTSVASILNYWRKELGWRKPGYHVIIRPDGSVQELLPISEISNGVAGFNSNSIHVAYIGGITGTFPGTPKDTRTPEQRATILRYLKKWKAMFPHAKIQGHRDFPNVKKDCPSFNAIPEYAGI